jgi:hypothetical protein
MSSHDTHTNARHPKLAMPRKTRAPQAPGMGGD